MAVTTTNLGVITAYGDAVAAGYTGTKAEWQALMASYATVAEEANDAKDDAVAAKNTAVAKATEATTAAATANTAKDTATSKATEATTAANTATTKANEASASAQSIAQSAAQIQENTDDIDEIESELAVTSPYNITWSQGGINSSGTAVSRTNRIRTDYITIENDSIFVEIPSGFKYAIHAYNSSKTRIGYIPSGSDIMTDRKATYKVSDSYNNAVYFRMWVAYADDSDILPTKGADVTVAPFESVIASLKSRVLKSVRILGVGNSYTRDSIRWLCKILKESGYEDVVVGHGYLGASTLAEQYASLDSSDSNHSAFEYWKYSNTKNAVKTSGKTLDEIFADEPWDIVVFQQQSDESGQYASYVSSSFDINDFVIYISGKVSNPDLKFALMMPWSHADGYDGAKFVEYYNSDPKVMLDAIKTVIPQVADHMSQCDYVVNAGEAIDLGRQNDYLNALGDQMLRTDKNHLYYGIPSYMVGLTYALTLCDVNLNNVMWYPTATDEGQTGITTSGYLAYLAKQCAFTAVNGYALADDVSDLKAEIGKKADYTDFIKAFPTDTATGAVASFTDGANLPVKSLVVDIDPVQDLHGQDFPYPAGGGKNLLNPETLADNTTLDGTTGLPTASSGRIATTTPIDVSTLSSVAISWTASISNIVALYSTFASGTLVRRVIGISNGGSIDVSDADQLYVSLYFNVTVADVPRFQIESGSTATAWSPYSNICPISGHTQAVVTRTGKNLFNKSAVLTGMWLSTTTGLEEANGSYCVSDYIPVKSGETVYIPGSGTARRWFYDKYKNPVTYLNNSSNQAFTPTADGYIRVTIAVSGSDTKDLNTYQIEYGSTATPYEPYSGQSINISLGQTFYGGKLDVTEGELVIDRAMVDLGALNWTYDSNGYFSVDVSINVPTKTQWEYQTGQCSRYKVERMFYVINTENRIDNCIAWYPNVIRVSDSAYTDATAFKTAVTGQTLVYELATPITVQLTPHEVTALLGSNNIWADSGDSAVEYRADPTLYVQRKIAEAISALS